MKEKKEKKEKRSREEDLVLDDVPDPSIKKCKKKDRDDDEDGGDSRRADKKSKKSKKREDEIAEEVEGEEMEEEKEDVGKGSGSVKELWKNGEQAWRDQSLDAEYLRTNPDGITRLFCGNLKLDMTEETLRAHIPGITFIKWQKDKVSKQFYGSTFLEMKDPKAAAVAVAMDRTKFQGRPLKIYFCPPRPGDVWPPVAARGGGGDGGGGRKAKPKTPKPPGGKKLYMGNLAYSIDDDTIVEFFKDCGEMRGLRWLVNEHTGDFRGGGFVEFTTSEAADQAILKDGQELLGRAIWLDWTL